MKPHAAEATLRSLHQLRGEDRRDAQASLDEARTAVAAAEGELTLCRDRLAKLSGSADGRASKVTAGLLQRRQSCDAALAGARAELGLRVKRALERLDRAQLTLAAAEDAWRDACGQQRVVERVMTRRETEQQRVEQRHLDNDNDDLAQRR